ncbi:cytidine and deoxycytidylate deaminase zinc-binding region [Pseudoflavonifractor capillosus ATCC 29799]|uniref:Cytidine and deoxycytidylate deaminase zinc-binding region n=1 Tax=Pseudoflavonifractor capillosus ATCC 29799 TaxID=411467 RepID=A6NY00_9FIRM|nr:cytidine and deoxycytidylate deaminase zinc-binding region [Pseudoflavonifractor capillosus ATCC 29799]
MKAQGKAVILDKNRRCHVKRIDKENYYLDIAETVAERATCLRRCYGAIIVRNDEIIATGYNGAPRGRRNCVDLNYCTREALNIPSGERYELCRSVHAEANAIISAARSETLGATLYMACKNPATGELIAGSTSCAMCRRLIINAGIQRVVIRNTKTDYSVVHVEDWVREDDSLPQERCSCCGDK